MSKINKDRTKEVNDILEKSKWQGFVSGKVEGALSVLYLLDLNKEKRVSLLSEACGLSRATALDFIEPKDIEYRIYHNDSLPYADREALVSLVCTDVMNDDTVMNHPELTLKFISSIGNEKFIEEAIPQAVEWVANGEEVTMRRVKEWLISKYA